VFGDGSQTRSFCYVSDLIDGIYRLSISDESGPMNIGNPHEMSILQLAHQIKDLAGSSSKVIEQPLPVDDPKVRQPDISLAREKLGWEPEMDVTEGLKLTLDYFRSLTEVSA
jgi:dTDP-glucose 4,6-dehydratase